VRVGLVLVQVAGFTGQAPPQSRPRYFWAHSETQLRLCRPELDPRGTGGLESFARLALTRVPLIATLCLELDILGEKPQALDAAGAVFALERERRREKPRACLKN
jgi:hypothetical protein